MRIIWFICFFFSVSIWPSEELPQCKTENLKAGYCCLDKTITPPFFITDNARDEDAISQASKSLNSKKEFDLYLPKGTIVQIPEALLRHNIGKDDLLPFKVISVPKPLLERTVENARKDRETFTKMRKEINGKRRVIKNEVGLVHRKALRKASDYVFYVNEDAPAYSTPKWRSTLNNKTIMPTLVDGEFKIKTCCENQFIYEEGMKTLCLNDYFFDVYEKDGEKIEEVSYEFLKCGALQHITAIPLENKFELEALTKFLMDSASTSGMFTRYGIDQLEMVMSGEGVKLVKLPLDELTGYGAFNTRPYNSDDEGGTDFFLKPKSMCGFIGVAKKFEQECKGAGCQVQFGDMYHEKEWGDHRSHGSGECVDIRPFRKTDDDITSSVTWHDMKLNPDKSSTKRWIPDTSKRNPRYDMEKTKKFIEMAIKNGATDIFFNDPDINEAHKSKANQKKILPGDSASAWDHWWEIRGNLYTDKPRHNDHIHMCFREKNPNVCPQK